MKINQIIVESITTEAHGNSKVYDKCWKGYKKVPGKKRGEKGSCVKEESNTNSASLKALVKHVKESVPLHDSIFRYQSEAYFDTFVKAKQLREAGSLPELDWESEEMLGTDIGESVVLKGVGRVWLDVPYLDAGEAVSEAEYQGKKVELNKPKRGGSKKFYVYTKNPKTGKIKKVSFGAKSGGGNLAVKLKDPKARKAFADRHNCDQKNDKTKAGYWACRLPRYAKSLGLSGGGTWW